MPRLRGNVVPVLVALCTAALSGCGDGSAPAAGTLSNPTALTADVNALGTPFNAQVVRSFAAVGLTASGTPAGRAVSYMMAMSPSRKLVADLGAQKQQALAVRGLRPNFNTTILPASVWGKTYVWHMGQQKYVEGTGTAPANGVRFILYAVDPLTDKPASPLNEVGYADLIDASTATVAGLQVMIVGTTSGNVTYADYTITASGSSTAFAAQAAGYVTDGTHRLDFTNTINATTGQVTIDYQVALDQNAVTARLQAALTAGNPTSTLTSTLRVTRGSEVVVLTGTVTVTAGSGSSSVAVNVSVTVDGGLFATITGTAQSGGTASLTYTGPGRDCTQDELAALRTLLDSPAALSGFLERLLAPAAQLLGSDVQLAV
jgi:hypothetical protein